MDSPPQYQVKQQPAVIKKAEASPSSVRSNGQYLDSNPATKPSDSIPAAPAVKVASPQLHAPITQEKTTGHGQQHHGAAHPPSSKSGVSRPGDVKADGTGKERRAAAGTDAVREQMRKMAVGGGPGKDDKIAVYAVSDSDDEGLASDSAGFAASSWSKPQEVTDAICKALNQNFVFKGISEGLLVEVVERMYGVCFAAGSVVLQQAALPKPDDCMYFLQLGEAEVVISGAVDQQSKGHGGEERKVEGHTVRIPQKPGWVFGDVALLFHSPRTASVVAKTNITVWALERKTFLQFVMKHAQGARALRFLRKLPLLKGLSDNDLIRAASRMPQRVYNDGQALVKYGERGDELFLIRYGKVRVLRPDGNGGRIEALVLGRGQFVGERAVINDRLRVADCVAQGTVQVVVMRKRDFMDLDNPLLAWMLDYDAVTACLRPVPMLKGLKQEQMEQILDRFDAREELMQGQTIINQGDLVDKMIVCKIGEVHLFKDGESATDTSFVKESGGFTYFGDDALKEPYKSKYTVKVSSENLHLLSLTKRALDTFLGNDMSLSTTDQVIAALKKSKHLTPLNEGELKAVLQMSEEVRYNPGDVVAVANGPVTNKVFLVKGGEVVLIPADVPLPGQVELGHMQERGRLLPGQVFNDEAVASPATASLKSSLVAASPNTVIITFTTNDVEKVAGTKAQTQKSLVGANANSGFKSINFADLEFHRIVGTGQFGLVRVVRNVKTNEVYALKVMHKAPITESKQVEHVINERRILQEASHPFCVRLCGAYQDRNSLYLLQEWVPGGELFHHLDLEGAFDEPTAMFFAASVLMALEFLHSKNMVYRDLKPENLLLDAQGYIKVADFGFAKFIGNDKTYTICGTPDYQAPEVIMRRGTTKAADYWALGVLIFEMLVGDPPFKSLTGDPWDTFRRTLSGRFYVPNFISDTAADLIFKLLQVNPEKRLGSGPLGAEEIRRHKWFARLDWKALEERKLTAPIRPRIRNPLDTSNFDNFDSCDVEAPPVPANRLEKHMELWDLWEWIEKPPTA